MKRLVLMAMAAMLFAMPAANAQKINADATRNKLAKSDAEIADAKKNVKAATWINRGKVYFDAYAEPTKNLFPEAPEMALRMTMGNPSATEETQLNGVPVSAWIYDWVKVYVTDGKVVAWDQTAEIGDNLYQTAVEAYAKAYELDPKQEPKIAAGLKSITDALLMAGETQMAVGHYAAAAKLYEDAFAAQSVLPSQNPDPNYLYIAGYLMTITASQSEGDAALDAFAQGEKYCNDAIAAGYKDEEGNIYYYLFHCYYGQKDKNRDEYFAKAKEALLEGIKLYPANEKILDGLMQFYTAEEGVGDPAELVEMIDATLANDSSSYDLWFGRGRVFFKLKNFDECIASFEKCAELRPEAFEPYFYTGYFYIEKGNALLDELNQDFNMSNQAYNDAAAEINSIYAQAIPWLEKAYDINPQDEGTVEYLKNICYRLRDEEGIQAKYEKYDAALKAIRQ